VTPPNIHDKQKYKKVDKRERDWGPFRFYRLSLYKLKIMAERKSLSKSTRFEVFKRDSFTCQYCGAKAPDVILEVDHIKPVCDGGTNDLMNLITSCRDCNRGKGKKKINDKSTLSKQREQIEELNLRRQQLEMLLDWRDGMSSLKNDISQAAIDSWNSKWVNTSLSDFGESKIKIAVKRYGLSSVLETMDEVYDKYFDFSKNDKDNANYIFDKLFAALNFKTMPPYRQKISYIKGILKNKMNYFNEKKFYSFIRPINNEESYELLVYMAEELKKYSKINSSEMEEVLQGIYTSFNNVNNE